jgi:SAM-dependent methyltransferase
VNLTDLIARFDTPPEPWSEGRTIPWDDPAFSARMLKEHLSQLHDGASRRDALIDQHVAFIKRECLSQSPARILDLGCGPGLYCLRLAEHGHDCTGIDFGPASIDYAKAEASRRGLYCRFELGDIRTASFESDPQPSDSQTSGNPLSASGEGAGGGVSHSFDLVMLLYGELNLFEPADTDALLQRCRDALAPDGRLLLEVHSYDLTKRTGERPPRWSVVQSGLFSDQPHLRCDQSFWLEATQHAAGRHWIVDAATGETTLYGWTQKAYADGEYEALLTRNGLRIAARHPSLTGAPDEAGFPAYVASRV